ncbi:arsenate reductase ArsC [Algimonas porphyrae]|uniref:Arsenate reductase n=2 Tax=Algimonas porphyrae TaxID=1128113 RepID=A0ABQ5V103_9PROT|nr:arsenate reductase [Algimonas porphyrae]
MTPVPYTVLFLCTGNSARSILSEALLTDLGGSRFRALSAGSQPSATTHPDGLAELRAHGHATRGYSSKSWDVFTEADAPQIDLVVTVCDSAAAESCPVYHGAALRVHWPAPDPAHIADENTRRQAFADVYALCRSRIEALIALSDSELRDSQTLQMLQAIGHEKAAPKGG